MKILEILLGVFLWAVIIAGMVGASVAFGAVIYTILK